MNMTDLGRHRREDMRLFPILLEGVRWIPDDSEVLITDLRKNRGDIGGPRKIAMRLQPYLNPAGLQSVREFGKRVGDPPCGLLARAARLNAISKDADGRRIETCRNLRHAQSRVHVAF